MAVLLPFDLSGFEVIEVGGNKEHIDVHAVSLAVSGRCPNCGEVSRSFHSRYVRRPRDLPCLERTIRLSLRVHRFLCQNSSCTRKTFVENLPEIVARYAHSTLRFASRLAQLGLALGGEAGARLGIRMGIPTSGNTILRILHRLPSLEYPSPRVLGIDDWAWRRGKYYGTIICDMERGCVIDLLPDSEAETVATWLKQHPRIEIVTRDRSSSYGDAINRGAPQAKQVADRWHLLKNLRDAVEQALSTHRQCLALKDPPPPEDTASVAGTYFALHPSSPKAAQTQRENRLRRLARYQQAVDLHRKGVTLQDIARQLGMSPDTVTLWLAMGTFPEQKPRPVGTRSLRPYLEYIHRRWDEGCHNASQIWREICQMGYDRGPNSIRDYCARLRQNLVIQSPERAATKPHIRRYSPREAAYLMTSRQDKLTPQQSQDLLHMRQAHPVIEEVFTLAQDFRNLLIGKKAEGLGPWIHAAITSSLAPFRILATGLHRDLDAVRAALELPWSNGRVEGHVNRLKLIKRQMYGRASFALLRTRILYPP